MSTNSENSSSNNSNSNAKPAQSSSSTGPFGTRIENKDGDKNYGSRSHK